MRTCFVMQPFDKGKFDKRYKDVFGPAIRSANLEPYRVDLDPKVRMPIQDIERGILESRICFAEITLDNPNVWFELGYAYASKKDVVLVCSDERTTKFPFDIQHRAIITYSTSSTSDYVKLKQDITNKLIAYLEQEETRNELGKIEPQPDLSENHSIEDLATKERQLNQLFYSNCVVIDAESNYGSTDLSVLIFNPPLSSVDQKDIINGQPYLLKLSYGMGYPKIDIYNKNKLRIGTVINTINKTEITDINSYYRSTDLKDFIDCLDGIYQLSQIEEPDGFIAPKRCEFSFFYENNSKFTIKFSSLIQPHG